MFFDGILLYNFPSISSCILLQSWFFVLLLRKDTLMIIPCITIYMASMLISFPLYNNCLIPYVYFSSSYFILMIGKKWLMIADLYWLCLLTISTHIIELFASNALPVPSKALFFYYTGLQIFARIVIVISLWYIRCSDKQGNRWVNIPN